jgi:hypothetical protein
MQIPFWCCSDNGADPMQEKDENEDGASILKPTVSSQYSKLDSTNEKLRPQSQLIPLSHDITQCLRGSYSLCRLRPQSSPLSSSQQCPLSLKDHISQLIIIGFPFLSMYNLTHTTGTQPGMVNWHQHMFSSIV